MKWKVIFEDNHLLAVNKPAGMLVHGDQTGDQTLLDEAKAYIKHKYNKPGAVFLHPVHRIDRPVSGIVLLARTSKAHDRLLNQFKDRAVKKFYLAVVEGIPDTDHGLLRHNLRKDGRTNRVSVVQSLKDRKSKPAETAYFHIATMHNRSLLLVQPITGRSHQIRVQLAATGLPISGDVKYGGPKHDNPKSILLHHIQLSLEHPVRKDPITFRSLPDRKSGWQEFADWLEPEAIPDFVGNLIDLT